MMAWLRSKWRWLVVALAVLAGVVGELLLRRRASAHATSQVDEANKREQEIRDEEVQQVAIVTEEHDQEISHAEQEHQASLDALTDEQKKKYEELKDDPDELNGWLVQVGKDVRGAP